LNSARSWNPRTGNEPIVILNCPPETAREARKWGFHSGYEIDNRTGIDIGLMGAFHNISSKPKLLAEWIEKTQRQVGAMDEAVCTIWHPDATIDVVKRASTSPVYKIDGDNIDELLSSTPSEIQVKRKLERCDKYIVLLKSPLQVMEQLRRHGFHSGHSREKMTRIDIGLKDVYASGECNYEKMRKWIELLKSETYTMNSAFVTVWHPLAQRMHLERSCPMDVIEIEANTAEEAIAAMENK
jgi:hypothetical protein